MKGNLTLDPITLEVIESSFGSAVTEMEYAVERTARSSIMKEQHDYRAAINDREGRAVSHVSYCGSMECIAREYPVDEMKEGDVFVYNDPYASDGGVGHLPDVCVIMPVIYEGEVIAFVQIFGHFEDVGGMSPGSSPRSATSMFQEGLMIPPVRLYDGGRLNKEVLAIVTRNSRTPENFKGDLDGEVNACRIGASRISELCRRYGKDVVLKSMDALIERCVRSMRKAIWAGIPNGEWEFEDFVESDGVVPDKAYKIKMKMIKTPERFAFDLTGCSEQAAGPINWPCSWQYYSRCLSSFLRPLFPGMVVNEGATQVVEVVMPPEGTLLNPTFPAPSCNRTITLQRSAAAMQGTVAKLVRGAVPADMNPANAFKVTGYDAKGKFYIFGEILGSGSGARSFSDGNDAASFLPGTRCCPVESSESRGPVLIERWVLRRDSAGAGKYRGGLGYEKDFRLLADGMLGLDMGRMEFSCWGLEGGKPGKPGGITINPGTPNEIVALAHGDAIPVRKGDLVRVRTAGAGGWGDPLERDPNLVRLDVIRNKVSLESARDDYGVVIDAKSMEVDEEKTQKQREKTRKERPALHLFDRGEFADRLIAAGKITVSDNPLL